MSQFDIRDEDLSGLSGKVVVVTGGSSGIGLATTQSLISLGAWVVNGDLNPPPKEHDKLLFVKTDVSQWKELVALFKQGWDNRSWQQPLLRTLIWPPPYTQEKHGHIDHVFANAGIGNCAEYLTDNFDESGELQEPASRTYDINLKGVVNTSYLGLHHMRHQDPPGGSIVLTASASSFQRLRIVDYVTSKHAVLGFMRGMVPLLKVNGVPIRCNLVAPSWTDTGLVPPGMLEAVGVESQSPEAVAKSVVLLMADSARQGQAIFSQGGKYWEVDGRFMEVAHEFLGKDDEDAALGRMYELAAKARV